MRHFFYAALVTVFVGPIYKEKFSLVARVTNSYVNTTAESKKSGDQGGFLPRHDHNSILSIIFSEP